MLPYDVSERAGTPFEPPAEAAFCPFADLLQRAFHQRFQQEVTAAFGSRLKAAAPNAGARRSAASPAVTTVTRHTRLIQGLPLSCPDRALMSDDPKTDL